MTKGMVMPMAAESVDSGHYEDDRERELNF
jgi:hypothetical protein